MLSGRARMIAGINRLTGRQDCREAVMLTTVRWGWGAHIAMTGATTAAVGAVLSVLVGPSAVVWAIAGGAGGSVMGYLGRRYAVLGRAGDEVVLARSKRLYVSPVAIVDRWEASKPVLVERGPMLDTIDIDGKRYQCPWAARRRLDEVLARPVRARGRPVDRRRCDGDGDNVGLTFNSGRRFMVPSWAATRSVRWPSARVSRPRHFASTNSTGCSSRSAAPVPAIGSTTSRHWRG